MDGWIWKQDKWQWRRICRLATAMCVVGTRNRLESGRFHKALKETRRLTFNFQVIFPALRRLHLKSQPTQYSPTSDYTVREMKFEGKSADTPRGREESWAWVFELFFLVVRAVHWGIKWSGEYSGVDELDKEDALRKYRAGSFQ